MISYHFLFTSSKLYVIQTRTKVGGVHKLIKQSWKEIIENKLCYSINPDFIMLFGSYAKGEVREDSDLDIAYFTKKEISDYERFMIAGQLANELKIETIDLVDIKQIDTVFAAQIFFTGILIYCKDESLFIKQRMKALSMYVTLNEQRKHILQGIDERGFIYEE